MKSLFGKLFNKPESNQIVTGKGNNPDLELFLKKISTWPPKQAAAASFVILDIVESNGELQSDIDGAVDELSVGQFKEVTELIGKLT